MKYFLLALLTLGVVMPSVMAKPAQAPPEQAQIEAQPILPPPAAPAANAKKAGKPREYFLARRDALLARKESQMQRMREFQARRALANEKAYQDWHERYLADAPVRVEYLRTLSDAYRAETALAHERTAFLYSWQPMPWLPVAPGLVYFEVYGGPYWGW